MGHPNGQVGAELARSVGWAPRFQQRLELGYGANRSLECNRNRNQVPSLRLE
jgi:hypothetical protein